MINLKKVKHIVINRIDNIGDIIVTLPMAAILKQRIPGVKITFLAREYARSIVEHCAHVDAFYSWDALSKLSDNEAIENIKAQAFDCVVYVFPHQRISSLMKKAGVQYRIGTARRIYLWWNCNVHVRFSRSKSDLHEAQLIVKLLKPFGVDSIVPLNTLRDLIGLECTDPFPKHLQAILKSDKFNLIVHPFTNGHTREWPTSHFVALINQLPHDKIHVIVSGSEKESEAIKNKIIMHCSDVTDISGLCNLHEFMQLIAHADGLLANATGPMHIAAALNIHTLGLFPATKYIDTSRWAPIGNKAESLSADPHCQNPICREKNDCICMESITVDMVKNKILHWL